jgi:hypothetical protein
MLYDNRFVAAYVLLLATIWEELEQFVLARDEIHAQALRLDLILLQQSLDRPRLPLRVQERARARTMLDQLVDDFDIEKMSAAPEAAELLQDLLYDEIRDLISQWDRADIDGRSTGLQRQVA